MKWIGNAGSHQADELTRKDVLDGYHLFKRVLDDVHEKVRSGTALSDAFAAHGDLFPRVYTASLLAVSVAAAASFRSQREDFMVRLSRNARLSDSMAGSHVLSCAAGARTGRASDLAIRCANPEAISQRDSAPPIGF